MDSNVWFLVRRSPQIHQHTGLLAALNCTCIMGYVPVFFSIHTADCSTSPTDQLGRFWADSLVHDEAALQLGVDLFGTWVTEVESGFVSLYVIR